MKTALGLCAGLLLLTGTLFAQAGARPGGTRTWQEPENHAITVERLMRYHDTGEYALEIQEVVNAAHDYIATRVKGATKGEKLAAVFDIDETSLSNWQAMAACGFCAYKIQAKLYPDTDDPAIEPVLGLFKFVRSRGIAVFFVTGRKNRERASTIRNLKEAGYAGWAGLIMQPDGTKPPAQIFKARDRKAIEAKGYRIILNIGDQASDLAGCCSGHVFKLPNPFYLIP